MRLRNLKESAHIVRNKQDFNVNPRTGLASSRDNLYGYWVRNPKTNLSDRYLVFSYGPHWPLFIWIEDDQRWYGNSEKRSQTTTRHLRTCQPAPDNQIIWLDRWCMLRLVRLSFLEVLAEKARGHPEFE